MTTRQISFIPSPHLTESIRNTQISYVEALSELIDNSFDAGATAVDVILEPKQISVSDNGAGCSDISAMLSLGGHKRTSTTRLGRYGVGLKNAALGLGDLLEISSACGDKRRTVSVDWENFEGWVAQENEEDWVGMPGTIISIAQLRKTKIRDAAKIRDGLSFSFTPGLRGGKQITLTIGGITQQVNPITEPDFEEFVEETIEDGDCGFRVKAGILLRGQNERKPFVICYEHRDIYETDEPCKDFSSSSRFFAWVELFGKWPLLKHKDGLSDKSEWLHNELHEICRDLLRKVHSEGESIELQELADELTEEFSAIVGRERRKKKSGEPNSVEPVESGRTRRTAERVNGNGSCSQRRGVGGSIIFTFDSLGEHIGRVNGNSKRTQIVLNQDHPFIAQHRASRDKLLLKSTAISLFVSFASQGKDNRIAQAVFEQLEGQSAHQQFIVLISKWLKQLSEQQAATRKAA